MIIEDYFQQIEMLVKDSLIVHSSSLNYDKRSTHIGFIRGSLHFVDGSSLHLREFVNVQFGVERYMYVFQYQCVDENLVFRYDNTPHFPGLPTFPHHKHEGSESSVVPASLPDLNYVLHEIGNLIKPPNP